jgi:hypothetical protein
MFDNLNGNNPTPHPTQFNHFAHLGYKHYPELPNPLENYLYTISEFLDADWPEPRRIIRNLLDNESRVLVGGQSKSFKSWLLLDQGMSVASAQPWIGFETVQNPVLIVNFELRGYYFDQRIEAIANVKKLNLRKLGETFQILQLRHWYLKDKSAREDFLAQLQALIKRKGIIYVIIDPYYRLLTEQDEEIAQTNMGAVLHGFGAINQAGASVAYAMHMIKGASRNTQRDPEELISGAGTLLRDPDSLITILPKKHEEESIYQMEFKVRDFPPIKPIMLDWKWPLLVPRHDIDPKNLKAPGGRCRAISDGDLLDFIAEHNGDFKEKELASRVAEQFDVSPNTARDSLKRVKTRLAVSPQDKLVSIKGLTIFRQTQTDDEQCDD